MKKCKICGAEKNIEFLLKYENTKVFESNCPDCKDSYIFYLEKTKEGKTIFRRTHD
jgi:hypothetical protein